MTLTELIDSWLSERRAPAPLSFVPAAVALTPRGDAAIACYRFVALVRSLDADDRAYILRMLDRHLTTA